MQVDWITVVAQIVNFLILLWLLRRFLYRPVLDAMRRREERIATRLAAAEESRREADERSHSLHEARGALERKRAAVLDAAKNDAAALRRSLEEAARRDIDEQSARWREQVERERDAFLRDLKQTITSQFGAVAKAALSDLADGDLEVQTARRLASEMTSLSDDDRAVFRKAAARHGVVIETALQPTPAAKTLLERTIAEFCGADAAVNFAFDPTIGFGLRLRAGGKTLEWTLEQYLEALIRAVDDQILRTRRGAGAEAA